MSRGKETCRILKEIRRQIAAANDIDLLVSECQYKGDCLGTCPKCEAEVRYLEQALERRRLAGRAVSLLGISAGLLAASTGVSAAGKGTMAAVQVQQDTTVAQDTARWSWEMCGDAGFNVARRVVDEENRPLQGVTVKLVRGELSGFEDETDEKGRLIILFCNEGDSLVLTYPGMETVREPAREGLGKVPIVMRRATAADSLILVERQVVDVNNKPLPGVSVMVEETKAGTLTDKNGRFSLRVPEGSVLVFSFVGMGTKRINVERDVPETPVVLEEEILVMGEMPVVGLDDDGDPLPVVYTTQYVSGVMTDKEGQPLAGVKIMEMQEDGDVLVFQTDEEGRFGAYVVLRHLRFKVVKDGYKTQKVKATPKHATEMHIVMKPEI